jgi:hypothetical protein
MSLLMPLSRLKNQFLAAAGPERNEVKRQKKEQQQGDKSEAAA